MLPRVLVAAVLLGVLTACGGSGADDAAATGSSAPTSVGSTDAEPTGDASATTGEDAGDAPVTVEGEGMPAGCGALHEAFAAFDAGDDDRAQGYLDAALPIFDDVAALSATDLELAMDGAWLASDLGFVLDAETVQGQLATDYAGICVAGYGAPAL